jgi:DNA transformation protein and related proteins
MRIGPDCCKEGKMGCEEYYLERLSPNGPVVARKMFGAVGFFMNGVIFALIIDGELYFRVDDKTRGDFENLGAMQFIYEARGKEVGMPYFVVPEAILNDDALVAKWMESAYQAALRNLSKKSKRKKRKSAIKMEA